MNKPEFLYHGSQYYFDILRPQKACGETQLESQFAIYAAKTISEVVLCQEIGHYKQRFSS